MPLPRRARAERHDGGGEPCVFAPRDRQSATALSELIQSACPFVCWLKIRACRSSRAATVSTNPASDCRFPIVRGYHNALSSRWCIRSRRYGNICSCLECRGYDASLGGSIVNGQGHIIAQIGCGERRRCVPRTCTLLSRRNLENGRPHEPADFRSRKSLLRTSRARQYIGLSHQLGLLGNFGPKL